MAEAPQQFPPPLDRLRAAHERLMREYADVSRLATHAAGQGGGPAVPPNRAWVNPWMVRRYVRALVIWQRAKRTKRWFR